LSVAAFIDSSMTGEQSVDSGTDNETLVSVGYWPARAAAYLVEGRYSRAVELCRENLTDDSTVVSGRLIYARALYCAGQLESAADQFFQVLALDPDNVAALKGLGDIRFAEGDVVTAFAHYERVLEIDPDNRGLCSPLRSKRPETTRTITIARGEETSSEKTVPLLREIYFYTETLGDLYLAQGHPRLAQEVFRTLNERQHAPRLVEKLTQAEKMIKEKGH
jgi:tetratricopeptide (TPR) repeat protein